MKPDPGIASGRNGRRALSRADFLKASGASFAALSLGGCGTIFGGEMGNEGPTGTLRTYVEGDIPELNSTTATDLYSFSVLANTNEGLYRLDPEERPQPAVAEDVRVSEDGLEYAFILKDGVKWSNGEPVTAEDFRYAWLRAMHPDTAGEYGYIIADFVTGGAEFSSGRIGEDEVGVRAPDARTLEVTLSSPTPFFLGLTAFTTYLPLNRRFVEDRGEQFAMGPGSLLYNGPYTLTEFESSEGLVLEKNPEYWDAENVRVDAVDLRVIKDSQTALNLYDSGELDTLRLTAEQADDRSGSDQFVEIPEFSSYYTVFNAADEALANINIRRALQLGFDRQAYVDAVLGDASTPAGGIVPEGVAGPDGRTFREFAGGDPVEPFDAERARSYWRRGVEELARDPQLELLTGDNSLSRDTAIFLQGQYDQNLGAEVEIDVQPFDAALERQQKGEFQIGCAAGWGADYNDAMSFLDLWTSSSEFNLAAFENDEYDRLIEDARVEPDERSRAGMLAEAERILLAEGAALAPNYYRVRVGLQKPRLRRAVHHPYGAELDFKHWRLRDG